MDIENYVLKSLRKNIDQLHNNPAYIFYADNVNYTTTFQQLSAAHEELTSLLDSLPKNTCLGLYMKNSICIPAIIYCLLKRDLCFIFIDPDRSAEENEKILSDLNIHSVLTENHSEVPFISSTSNKNDYCTIYGSNVCLFRYPNRNSDTCVYNYKNICYVMQTSGTLGERKYVRVTNYSINSNIKSLRERLSIAEDDVIYFGTALTFDPCLVELFLGLAAGACLVGTSMEIKERPDLLLKTLFQNNSPAVTVMQMCPSVLLRWSNNDINFILNESKLRVLALGGEPFPEQILKLDRRSELKLFNLYGITEVSCWASVCEVENAVTLGDVLDDTVLEVRNNDGHKIDDGEGLLFIGTRRRICLINNEKLENIKIPLFRPTGDVVRVTNNALQYLGRSDHVAKRFGHRVNLIDIERNIFSSIQLMNKCVWLRDLHKITVFIVVQDFAGKKDKIIDKIRVKLLKDLPSYKFPDCIELLSELPLTPNGKINTTNLENLGHKYLTEKSTLTFTELWCKYLGLSVKQAEEKKYCTFTELGGTSISKLQLISELRLLTNTNFDGNTINTLLDSTYEDGCKNLCVIVPEHFSKESVGIKGSFRIIWKYNLYACIDTTVELIIKDDCKHVAVGNFANLFMILNADDAKEISQTWLPHNIENACCVSPEQDNIYVGCFDGCMYALDVNTCDVVWQYRTQDQIKNTACLSINKTALVFGSYDNYLYCVNLTDGGLIWKRCLSEPITSNAMNKLGRIIVACIKGTIAWLKESSGEVEWTFKAKNPIFASPESVGNLILFADVYGFIYCFNYETIKLAWIYKPAARKIMYSSFVIYENLIVFGTKDKTINILEFSEVQCTLKQCFNVDYEICAKPALLESELREYFLFVTVEGAILLYRLTADKSLLLIDSMALGGKCFASPIVHNNELYIGCRDNYLYRINVDI